MNETPTTSKQPLVFIILVNWNGMADSLACLRSLQEIDYQNFQTVLVDNGSSDGSAEAISEAFPQVRIIRNAKNERFAHANNQGIELALKNRADFVLLLNNDTLVDLQFLQHLIARAQSDERIGVVGPKIYFADQPQQIWYAGAKVSLWRGLIAHIGIREAERGQYQQAGETGYVTGCCLLASRACLEKTGPLDEGYFIYTEDADWCWRARQHGFLIYFEPAAKIWHKISASSGGAAVASGLTGFKIFYKVRGMLKFFGRYARWYHWLTIPFCWAIQFVQSFVMLILAKNWAGIRALLRSFTGARTHK